MKTYKPLKAVAVSLLALLIFTFWRHTQLPPTGSTTSPSLTKDVPKVTDGKPSVNEPAGQPPLEPSPAQHAKFMGFFATPIRFFGKVVDQTGSPIVGAKVALRPHDRPSGKGSTIYQVSDASGNFSVSALIGAALYIEVEKDGYYRVVPREGKPGSYGGFDYALNQGQGIHSPDAQNPVVFVLHKPGAIEPLIHQPKLRPRVPKDGSVLKVSLDPSTRENLHYLEIQCWTDDKNRDENGRFDWRFKVTVPNGGLLLRKDQYDFEAPLNGYQTDVELHMPKTLDLAKWRRTFEGDYFVRFDDNVFARVNLSMGAFGAHYVVVQSYLNPKPGSRNLEADPSQR